MRDTRVYLLALRAVQAILSKLGMLASVLPNASFISQRFDHTRLLRPCTPLPNPYQLAKEAVTAVDGADRRARRNGAQQPSY